MKKDQIEKNVYGIMALCGFLLAFGALTFMSFKVGIALGVLFVGCSIGYVGWNLHPDHKI